MKTIKTIILVLTLGMMNQFGNAQGNHGNINCNCSQLGWGCLTLDYTCRMYCSSYCIDYCNKHPNKCARMSATVSTDETYAIDISPNPVSNSATISFSIELSEKVSFRIFDMTGRLVQTLADASFEEGDHEIIWNVTEAKAGIYFLRMETENYSENKKIIVNK